MLSLFKRSGSAADLAAVTWEGCSAWPTKHGDTLREEFSDSFDREIDKVCDEMVYYLSFATDYAFDRLLDAKPKVKHAVRDAFYPYLAQFARDHQCPPVPPGEWLGEGLIWMPGLETAKVGKPWDNLKSRFALYGESLARRHDRSAAERTAHILAALCGTMDATFIQYAMPVFLGKWDGVQNILRSFRIKT
jgi:hypothetical protein